MSLKSGNLQTRPWGSGLLSRSLIGLLTLLILLGIWEAAVRGGAVEPLFLPAPSDIWNRAVSMLGDGTLVNNILASTRRVMVGFCLASLVAVPLGILLGSSPFFMAVFNPLLSFLRPLPSMSWVPLSLLWFGISETQKYSIVFMGSLAPALLYVIESTRNVDPILIRAAKNLGANRYHVMFGVILPSALPQIITGLKVMLGIAWTCVISAELIAAREGLGFMIMNGKEYFQTDTVMLGMVMISVTVLVTDLVLRFLEKRLVPWQD
jgi:taurine transport system permease protein